MPSDTFVKSTVANSAFRHTRQLYQGTEGGLTSELTRAARSASGATSPEAVELGIEGQSTSVRRNDGLRFRFLTGVISKSERARFERMIFRSTRGNCLMRFTEIDEPIEDITTGLMVLQEVFIIFFQASYIESKIRRICEAFSARLHSVCTLVVAFFVLSISFVLVNSSVDTSASYENLTDFVV